MGSNLTAKQEHFAVLIAKGVNGTEAAKTAGYAEKSAHVTASQLLRLPKVGLRIAELKDGITAQVVERVGIDKAWVIAQLVENVEMGKQAVPVVIDGVATGEYEQQLPAANKALELIGKELGMFVERREVRTGNLDLTDEQLDAAVLAARALVAAQGAGAGAVNAQGSKQAAGLSTLRQTG